MANRYALLLDGGYVTRRLYKVLGNKFPVADDVIRDCTRIGGHESLSGHELLRIYFYDAPPATGVLFNPVDKSKLDLSKSETYTRGQSLLDTLELSPNFAVRKGEVTVRGWRVHSRGLKWVSGPGRTLRAEDVQPDITQKGVDLRIGLDIARLSLGHLVSTIVVVTGDADLIPAFKFARREGIRLYLDTLGNKQVRRELKAHADIVIG